MQLRIRPQQRHGDDTRDRDPVPEGNLGCRCGHNQAKNKEYKPGHDIGVEKADAFPAFEPHDLQTKKEDDDI